MIRHAGSSKADAGRSLQTGASAVDPDARDYKCSSLATGIVCRSLLSGRAVSRSRTGVSRRSRPSTSSAAILWRQFETLAQATNLSAPLGRAASKGSSRNGRFLCPSFSITFSAKASRRSSAVATSSKPRTPHPGALAAAQVAYDAKPVEELHESKDMRARLRVDFGTLAQPTARQLERSLAS